MTNDNNNKPTKNEEEEKMSPEERMKWLREHGIEIVTPEERRAAAAAAVASSATNVVDATVDNNSNNNCIQYVMIPADINQPMQQLELSLPIASAIIAVDEKNETSPGGKPPVVVNSKTIFQGGDLLADHLQSTEFRKHADQVDTSLLPQGSTLVSTSSDGTEKQPISQSALDQVAQLGNVETFSLIHPTTENQYTSTLLYCDEIGMLKRLAINKRASQLANLVGYNPPPVFYGNVFICRLDQRNKQNQSVQLSDLQPPYAKWFQKGEETNLNYQMEMNRITGKKSETQAAPIANEKEQEEDGYSWTQTEEEVEVVVPITKESANIKKDIQVKFATKSMTVLFQKETLVTLKLFEKVDTDGCTWTLDKKNSSTTNLVITLEKVDPAFWPRIQV